MDDDGPLLIPRGYVQTNDYLLTNAFWCNGYGRCPETGIRRRMADGTYGDFHLIQHGHFNFAWVNEVMLKALKRGWSHHRIMDFLENIKNRPIQQTTPAIERGRM